MHIFDGTEFYYQSDESWWKQIMYLQNNFCLFYKSKLNSTQNCDKKYKRIKTARPKP